MDENPYQSPNAELGPPPNDPEHRVAARIGSTGVLMALAGMTAVVAAAFLSPRGGLDVIVGFSGAVSLVVGLIVVVVISIYGWIVGAE